MAYDASVLAKGTAAAVVQSGLEDWFFITADVAFGHSPVADSMRELPINDFMIKNGTARKDGRIVHDCYMFEVKSPEESEGPWDLYKLARTIPASEVTPPEGTTGCPL